MAKHRASKQVTFSSEFHRLVSGRHSNQEPFKIPKQLNLVCRSLLGALGFTCSHLTEELCTFVPKGVSCEVSASLGGVGLLLCNVPWRRVSNSSCLPTSCPTTPVLMQT